MRRAASSATSGETAATAATSWPAKRTVRDSVVHTALTPGRASAREVSIFTISAAGTLAPTILPQSMPGRLMSKVYFARPVTFCGPSSRVWRPLTIRSGESRSQGLMSPSAACTSSVWGAPGMPAFTVKVTVGASLVGVCWVMGLPLLSRGRLDPGRFLDRFEYAAAAAAVADLLGSREVQLVAERVQERDPGLDGHGPQGAVDLQAQGHGLAAEHGGSERPRLDPDQAGGGGPDAGRLQEGAPGESG